MRAVPIFVLLFFCVLFLPSAVLAADAAPARYVYPTASIFAWAGSTCPRGSATISDPVYRDLGRQSGAVYCVFPARELAANADGTCPEGFARSSRGRCADQRGQR